MRLTAERLAEITHLTRKSSQVAWFRQYLGVDVPCDRFGPILTDTTYEKLLEKKLGLVQSNAPEQTRNKIYLVRDSIGA